MPEYLSIVTYLCVMAVNDLQCTVDVCRWLMGNIPFAGHFGTSWVKHYCTYQRDSKQITMVPFDQKSGGKGVSSL